MQIILRGLHIFQLSSYQNPSYRRWLSENYRELFGIKRIFPLLIMLSALCFGLFYITIAGGLLFLLINQPPKAKKPLVFTPRIKRLMVTCFALSLPLIILLPPFAVLFEPWLIMLFNAVNSPLEKHISKGFINDAKRILQDMPGLKTIGITGSFGKTSTKYFLERLLSVDYSVYMTPGNYNTTLGVTRAVRQGLRPIHQVFLCEMGARHVGDIKEVCALATPQIGIITSVGEQHLETFGSLENVLKTKLELYDAVKDHGVCFINIDSKPLEIMKNQQNVITYGNISADYTMSALSIDQSGCKFTVTAPDGERADFQTRLLGAANAQNILGAVAVAHYLGIALPRLVPAVRQLESVPHRLELKAGFGMTIIDDAYNSNPAGAAVALDTLKLCRGTRIVVTPGLVELGDMEEARNRELGAHAAGCCDFAVLVGKARAVPIAAGLEGAGFSRDKIYIAPDINDALEHVRLLNADDKMVLLLNDLPDNYFK